jgi:hypothetical protein
VAQGLATVFSVSWEDLHVAEKQILTSSPYSHGEIFSQQRCARAALAPLAGF